MDFYFISERDDTTFRLPVNPERVQFPGEKQIETVNIVNLGEVDFPWGDRVFDIRFSSFFPRDYDEGYCNYPEIPAPDDAVKLLERWRDEAVPLRFIVTETTINRLVYIASFAHEIRGGEPGDIYYDIQLRQWREIKVRKIEPPAPPAKVTQRPRVDLKPVPKTYTVKQGDTLWKIAKKLWGSGDNWKKIYDANKTAIGPDPDKLKLGMKLVIPE